MPEQPIFLTRPYLPPLEEFLPYLEEIWASRRLTNGGPFHQQFEEALRQYLGVPHVCLFTNGTLALMTALQALRITGEVITTPYTFAATAHALLWNGIKPVFVDVRPTPATWMRNWSRPPSLHAPPPSCPCIVTAIPAPTQRLQQIADTYGLKLIYDAAHARSESRLKDIRCSSRAIWRC
jgi:dTDP-4-amino-4,6-dideoxygalactose transaminase